MRPKALACEAMNRWVWEIIDDYSHRFEVYCGGAGSGKSYGACQKVLLKALNRKRKVLVVRKVGATLKNSVFQLFVDLLRDSGVMKNSSVYKSDLRIELTNGSIFIFKGMDDPEKIKSITGITDIVIEEATELTLDDFTQLNLRLRSMEGQSQIFLMFNPVSKQNWVYSRFFGEDSTDALIIKTTYKDNKFLPEEYIKTLEDMKSYNTAYYKIYALGEFAVLDKLVFPLFEKRLIGRQDYPLFVGLDFGYANDPSAIVWGYYNREGREIYIAGEYVKKGLLADALAGVLKELGLSKEVITADCSRPETIADLKRNGITRVRPSRKGADSVMAGLQFIGQHRIIVDERCCEVISELENYSWKKDASTGEYKNEPIDSCNHCIDAIRYGLEGAMRERRARVYDRKRLSGIV